MNIKNLYILIILTLSLLSSCVNKSNEYAQLERVDTLLYRNLPDSADKILKDIEPQNAEDSAYFNILRTQTDYLLHRTNIDFTDINYSIEYYNKNFNSEKLSNAYYYKALIYIDHDSITKEMILLLKEAEKISESTTDDDLKYKISTAFVYANNASGYYEEALKYAKKEYKYAHKTQNSRDIAYALLDLSMIYKKIGQKDSSEYYIMECHHLTELINDEDKSLVYIILGENLMASQPDSAKKYLETALKYKKISTAYQDLAEIYFTQNNATIAEQYCDSALMYAWYKTRWEIYGNLAQKHYDNNDIEKLKSVTDKIIIEGSNNMELEYYNFVLELQREFDFEKQEIEYVRNIFICIAAIVFLTALCIILHQKRKQEKQAAIQKELEIENHNLQLFNELCELKIKLGNFEQNIQDLKTENLKLSERQYSEE